MSFFKFLRTIGRSNPTRELKVEDALLYLDQVSLIAFKPLK